MLKKIQKCDNIRTKGNKVMQQINKKLEKRLKLISSITKKIYSWMLSMGEIFNKIKHITWNILKIVVVILMIFSIPFILPSILKLLIKIKWFDNRQEFLNYFNVFTNKYVIIYLAIGILLFLGSFGNLSDNIKEILKKIKEMNLEIGSNKASIKFEEEKEKILEESKKAKEVAESMRKVDNPKENQKNILEELKVINNPQTMLKDVYNKKIFCNDCDSNRLKEENDKFRSFAAYNIINQEAKTLLHIIYDQNYIEAEKFKNSIINGYKKRNKNKIKFSHKDINKLANNKYQTIYNGLKFLNIIEPSEYDDLIKLTSDGKKFVEEYIESEERV